MTPLLKQLVYKRTLIKICVSTLHTVMFVGKHETDSDSSDMDTNPSYLDGHVDGSNRLFHA